MKTQKQKTLRQKQPLVALARQEQPVQRQQELRDHVAVLLVEGQLQARAEVRGEQQASLDLVDRGLCASQQDLVLAEGLQVLLNLKRNRIVLKTIAFVFFKRNKTNEDSWSW